MLELLLSFCLLLAIYRSHVARRRLAAGWLARAVRLCVCAAVAWRSSRRAVRLGPLVLESETLGWVAEPFYGALVCDAPETLLFALARAVQG